MKESIKRIILTSSIIATLLFIVFITFIYITYKNDNEIDFEDINSYLEIKYSDTSNVTLLNVKKGDSIEKKFTVKNISNKSLYYSIILSNVVNNYDNFTLSYSLISDDGAYVKKSYILNDNYILASLIKLEPSKEHSYILKIIVNDNVDSNKTFSSIIKTNVISTDNLFESDSLINKIISSKSLSEGVLDNENDGLYYTNNTINGNTVYFYRGNNSLNNNVLIGNYCFKIVRTTEDLGVRLIYNGNYNNGICDGSENAIDLTVFNNKSNYNAYVGYMYGNANSGSYESEHNNNNQSVVMKKVNLFYQNNLIKFSSLFQDSVYCSNRKTSSFVLNSVKYDIAGYKNYNTGYQSMYNIINDELSLKCDLENDRLTSNKLSYPVGMLTVDEAVYAGLDRINNNENNYLYSSLPYWTITPAYYNGINAYNFIIKDGKIEENAVNKENYIRPVITLKKTVKIKSGDGSFERPYVVEVGEL